MRRLSNFAYFRGLHELESAKQQNTFKLRKLMSVAGLAIGI